MYVNSVAPENIKLLLLCFFSGEFMAQLMCVAIITINGNAIFF